MIIVWGLGNGTLALRAEFGGQVFEVIYEDASDAAYDTVAASISGTTGGWDGHEEGATEDLELSDALMISDGKTFDLYAKQANGRAESEFSEMLHQYAEEEGLTVRVYKRVGGLRAAFSVDPYCEGGRSL